VVPLTDRIADIGIDDAYRISQAMLQLRLGRDKTA
jgi:hypothetical protein